MKIAFLHPDLGIGGAERLVVDAALALKSKGHEIRIFTAHHDPEHCFAETKDGSLNAVVVGDWLPRSILSRFIALCSYFRMIYAAFYLIFFSNYRPDIVICDQVSACIPILKWKGARVIFYCHFPDKLLTERKNWIKKLYRLPLDWLEEKTTGMADTILVNSNFTAKVFRQTFPSLKHVKLEVVYPTINVNSILRPLPNSDLEVKTDATTIFLSLNRYERKKNISLAIDAMKCMQKMMPFKEFLKIHLIIAGGYDERVAENQEHYQELKNYVESLELEKNVSFLKSPNDDKKRLLFHCSTAVLYTPSNEHFGIVPLEAMLLGRPVLACNSGGPLETVVHESTGFLCNSTPESFAEKMILLTRDHSLARELGVSATEHVRKKFSFQNFATKLNSIIEKN
ncbi:alpha-1,3/1,6-mannosyltransferase ALG2-like [Stegodyphus dumicola]|uniref:alpha-1,3/1,6-mannosyltransferase ALG2-like n=1 Tax=Stegodyphus dumicola TaxID=202533 RepID=UPI0015AB9ECE|nr:alpha-1,3/1,6-mannosyltransferase ALG2-like [Stegodyphus dumicola]